MPQNCPFLKTHFLISFVIVSSVFLSLQVSTIATSDDYAKNLADSFEQEARLQGIRIYASSRLSGAVNPAVLDSKLQMVRE